jgi:hypothetical protein
MIFRDRFCDLFSMPMYICRPFHFRGRFLKNELRCGSKFEHSSKFELSLTHISQDPIVRFLNLQLQRQRCSRLVVRFYIGEKLFLF